MTSWIERLFSSNQALPTIYTADGRTSTAVTSDPFRLSIVITCRQLLADTCASFPLFATDAAGIPLKNQPIFLQQPDPLQPVSDLLERIVNDMTRHGAAWLRVTARDARGWPLAIEIVDPQQVQPIESSNRQYLTGAALNGVRYGPEDLVQVPFILDDGPVGRAPILEANDLTENLKAAYLFSSTFYGAGALPPYIISSPTRLPKAHADELMTAWLEARDKVRPAVLTGDLSLQTFTGQSAADALLLDAINHFEKSVAALFMVPPSVVNVLSQSSLTYNTTRQANSQFLAQLNIGFLKRLETTFTSMLPRGQLARFDTSSLLELDETERLTNALAAFTGGIIDRDEARNSLGKEFQI